ncbi:MAG: hypothetical protein B6A08_08805 [Sorangiineae bacterium NIC37A_2]|jgi:hypothetical protein|nr:MAG: hypothetical protein B6A08_08805 [Sorangiineae bacterium NIC37A_2]
MARSRRSAATREVPVSPAERATLEASGFVLLRGAVPRDQLRPLREQIYSDLSRHGIAPSGRGLPPKLRALPPFQQIGKLSALAQIPDLSSKLSSPRLQEAARVWAQGRPLSIQSQLLLSPPNQGEFRLTGLNWHTDLGASQKSAGLQAFVLIDDVEPKGGPTLLLSRSHLRPTNAESEGELRRALRDVAQGSPLLSSIIGLSGQCGDVYLMDMRVLHTPSVNASSRFRLVGTIRYLC